MLPRNSKQVSRAIGTIIIAVSLTSTAIVSELMFRSFLFSQVSFMEKFRKPGLYASAFPETDTYWLLFYYFGGRGSPENPDPLLGWAPEYKRMPYLHDAFKSIGGKRPVLLYGDSFANCNDPYELLECFQGYLNNDEEFAHGNFFLNYGVGGYGVDQIYLLYKNSIHYFQDPFVIISFMLYDLDRSILSVRGGQKPYFEHVGDEIVLRAVPVNPDQKSFYRDHPPQIWSYLFRLWLYGDGRLQYLRNSLRAQVERPVEQREKTEFINKHIILNLASDLRKRHIEYIFLIFYPQAAIERHDEWREAYVKKVLEENHVRYLSSKDIVVSDSVQNQKRIADYFIPGDGHPNSYQNRIIAREIKRAILQ